LCRGTDESVRHSASPIWLCWASDVHTFWPLSTHSSPSRSARMATLARSEPAAGSLKSWQPTTSPRYIPRR
jgi:hypothetical protein